jgi:hypothetical protein
MDNPSSALQWPPGTLQAHAPSPDWFQVGGRKDLIDEVIERLCKKVSQVRGRIAYQLNHEMGVPLAEIARHVGVCTSAVAKAIENIESRNAK